MTANTGDWLTEGFEAHRAHLRAVAYRMLGSTSEADDAVQEAWLRLSRSDASRVRNLGGWLTTVVGRICLDMLRARTARREAPLDERAGDLVDGPDPEQEALMADSVGLALMVLLETLSPAERLAFVLHDMFSVPFDEIAPILERTPDATKMLASRARQRIKTTDATPATDDPARQRAVVGAFLAAARSGDFGALVALLHPDVVLRADPSAIAIGAPPELRGAAAVAPVLGTGAGRPPGADRRCGRRRLGTARKAGCRVRLRHRWRPDRRHRAHRRSGPASPPRPDDPDELTLRRPASSEREWTETNTGGGDRSQRTRLPQPGPVARLRRRATHGIGLDIPEHTRPGTPERSGVRLAEVMAALSLATDLGMGQPMEQGLGVCLLAVRFGEKLGLDDDALGRLYDIALLRHIGCTAETVGFAAVMGDELAARRRGGSFVDWGRPPEAIGYVVGHVARTNPPLRAARMLVRLPVVASRMKAGAVAVCEVAELLAQRFAIDTVAHGELVAVYERWDGRGFPGRLRGEAIPPVARIVQLAEAARMFAADQGPDAALAVLRRRAGGAYDPELVERFCRVGGPLLHSLAEEESLWDATLAAEPSARPPLDGTALDSALRAIGEFADLKSPSTVGHSSGVAELAAEAGAAFGCSEPERTELRRAGWVHDVGRVGVSSLVWEKPGPLSHGEREQVRLHPYYTERVLARPRRLAELGRLAAAHHERLDGSGYHRCVPASLLSAPARILAAADAYRAMTEPRPHRHALAANAAAAALRDDARAGRLDGDAVHAVLTAAGHAPRRRADHIAGLTARELEVLQLVARGLTTREIARRLVIAPKTADAHIQHIYAKIGVSTRAAATMFAMQHDLVG